MCEPIKYNLIMKEKAFKAISDKMYSIRSEYVQSRGKLNTLFILDKVIIKYLEQVGGVSVIRYKSDIKTLLEHQRIHLVDIAETRRAILSCNEMRYIVLNGLSYYEKTVDGGKMVLIIDELTVIDIKIMKD